MFTKVRQSHKIQLAVILALFLRELKTRFGKYIIGYFWPIMEPLAHISILAYIFSFRGDFHSSGLPFTVFFASGIIPYLLFSNIVSRSINAIESNKGLFNYRQVLAIDTIFARSFLEAIIYILLLLAIMSAFPIMGYDFTFNSLPLLIYSLLLLIITAFSFGLVFMVSGALYPESKKILSLILKPLYFISGIFFSISDLPPQYVDIMTLNPILNLVEMVRDSLFYGFDSQFVDFYHATITTLVFLFISLYVYNRNKIKIHMS